MSDRVDLAVVGSGIVGLAAAYAASRRGEKVVVIDRTSQVCGATVRNFGHACIGAQAGPARHYADLSREIWLALARDAGFWVRESGTLIPARHEDELVLIGQAAVAGGIDVLDADEIAARVPVRPDLLVGGGWIRPDLQTNPREAGQSIAALLARRGVEFRMRTAATGVHRGRVETTRGTVHAGRVVVAVNHDLDQLLPGVAEPAGVMRCSLDMLRVRADLARPLPAPLLTGWSLLRYGRFAHLPGAAAVRARLHGERPDLARIDLNQMYTQLPDGTLLVGDSHRRGVDPDVFQPEATSDLLLDEAASLFGVPRPAVVERWSGVYATGPDDFLIAEPEPGVLVLTVTTGIGMTTGLGLAEAHHPDHRPDDPTTKGAA